MPDYSLSKAQELFQLQKIQMVKIEQQDDPFISQKKIKNYNQRSALRQKIKIAFFSVLLAVAIIYLIFFKNSSIKHQTTIEPRTYFALLGDIGGTNIRYQLVSFNLTQKLPLQIIKEQRYKVKDFLKFQQSIQQFLKSINYRHYPQVAVIAAAGPVSNNSIILTNVQKWGTMRGAQLGHKLKIPQFLFINDFQAVSYGLQIIQDHQFVHLNNKTIGSQKTRGVIGPGTGLGHSVIIKDHSISENSIVLPSEAGHADVPLIDQQTIEYINFLKLQMNTSYITLQKAFCGPSIPYMFQFYAQKLNITYNHQQMTSQKIAQQCVKYYTQPVFQRTFQLFIKFYSSAIANFMIQHMTTGGIFLVGGLTKTMMQKMKNMDILRQWKARHPQSKNIVQNIPLVFCNQIDLGLRGAYVMAKRVSRNNKKLNKNNQDAF